MALHGPRWWVLALIACALGGAAQEVSPRPPLPALIHAEQVRHLSPEQAALGYPVRIRGVITGDVPAPDFFIQDSTAGVYVEGSPSPTFPHFLGDLVELEGVTGPGKFAPVIRESSLRVLGKGKLPEAPLYSFNEIANGQQDSQRVQIRGIVRSTSIDRSSWHELTLAMNVASGGGQFKVRVPIDHEQDFSSWIDSEVLIEGVCGSLFNSERQLAGVLFYVPRLSFIKVEAPAKEVPFAALLKFSPDQGAGHRVRVRGVVAYQQPGDALFLQSLGKGLRVVTQQDTRVEIGDVVDVLGFPAVGESAPALEDAVFHRIAHETSPQPVKLDLTVPWERYDGALVTTQARLLQREQRPDGVTLLLQQGGIFFSATAHAPGSAERLLSVPLNSELRMTGICLVRSGGLWRLPESFRLLLRTPNDVVVLRAPSWWNLRHTLWLLGIASAVLLAMISWVVVLGRRLREQMAIIRQKLRSGAVLEERNRIARELHDTLEQELAGITMQLDLAVDCYRQAPGVAQRALETARNMTRHSMREARRSVWDLRCHLLEHGDLVSALRQAVEPLALGNQIQVEVKVEGVPRRLEGPIEMNLLRIGQEAATNAVKHARAQNITLELQYDPGKVRLCVHDDGRGFSSSEAALSGNGHFGLLDMRERAQSLGSDLLIQSEPGGGTRIEVEVAASPKGPPDAESKAHTYFGRG
jgi:signal transduction histidine kinase